MGLQTLYTAGAFGPGSDLWIIPDPNLSSWSKLIDWYLNYQISRAKLHQPMRLPERVQLILEENEIPPVDIALSTDTPLMLAAENRLPSQQVVVLPSCENGKDWLARAHKVWEQLGKPTLRLFLPNDFDATQFQTQWPGGIDETDITLVSGQAHGPG